MVWTAIISNGIDTISKYIMTDSPDHSKALLVFREMEVDRGMFLVALIKGRHEVYV